MNLQNEQIFWKKKEYVSFLLSILVFFIHSYFAQNTVGDTFISIVNQKFSYFFSRSITQFAVPMFFILSGITFFKEFNNKKYLTKIKSRVFTLIIPYLLWNTVWMIWEIICSYSFISNFSAVTEPYPLTISSILKGIFFYGCNTPFWFIFDLIIFSLFTPLFFIIIRNKYFGIGAIIVLTLLSLFGIHMPTDLFYYPMAVVFYLLGAIIGYHFFDFVSKKSTKPLQIISIVFLSVYILVKNIAPQELHIHNYLFEIIIYCLAAYSLWNIVDIFIEQIKPREIYRRSFAIYALHLHVAIVLLKILSLIAPQNEWLEIPKFLLMVILTLIIINYICVFLERFLPKVYSLFMGKRLKH